VIKSAFRHGDSSGRRPGWRITWPYDPELLEIFKRDVPHQDREWDPEGGFWWVAQEHEETLLRLFPSFEAYLRQGSLF